MQNYLRGYAGFVGIGSAFLMPFSAFAVDTIQRIFCTLGQLVATATPIVAGLSLLAFFWGLAMYLFSLSAGEGSSSHSTYGMPSTPQGKRAGRTIMLYGVIVLFVMVSVWGLVKILQATFGITGGENITPPRLTSEPITIPQPSCN